MCIFSILSDINYSTKLLLVNDSMELGESCFGSVGCLFMGRRKKRFGVRGGQPTTTNTIAAAVSIVMGNCQDAVVMAARRDKQSSSLSSFGMK